MRKWMIFWLVLLSVGLGSSANVDAALSPVEPRGIMLGSSLDAKYSDSLVIFTRQNLYFMPWLEEIRVQAQKVRPYFKIYIYLEERPNRLRRQDLFEQYQGAPEYLDWKSAAEAAIMFENGHSPAFYLFDSSNRLVYKHLGFVLSDWYVLDEVLQTYLQRGQVPQTMQEYNFELHSRFPILTIEDIRGEKKTIQIKRPTVVLISDPFPTEDPKRQMIVELVQRLQDQFHGSVDFYVILQNDTDVDYAHYKEYARRYKLDLPWKKENNFFKRIKRDKVMKDLDLAVLVDRDRTVWRKLGYPLTATIAIFDGEGMLMDYRCAVCDNYQNLEGEYWDLLNRLLKDR